MEKRTEVLVIGGGPVGACSAYSLARAGARVTLIEKETEVCPPTSGAHANCGLIVPSDSLPLATPGVLGRGVRWMLDSSSPFYIAPRLSPALAHWLWLFRAACSGERAQAAMPVLRALHVASTALHDELGRTHRDAWLYRQNGVVQVYETPAGMEEAGAEAEQARALGARAEELSAAAVRERFPGVSGDLAGGFFFPEDGHLDPLLFTREMAGSAAAAGAWTPALARGLGLHLPIEPAKGYSVDVARPAGFPELPFYLGEARVVMTPLGEKLRLGSTLELSGWDMRIRRKRVAHLRRGGQRMLGIPDDGPVEQIWRGPRPVTPDGLPVIGRVPRCGNVILATGHCMLGLSLGPITGKLVAELAGGQRPSLDLTPLSPARFG